MIEIETKGAGKVRHCELETGEKFTLLPPKECIEFYIDKEVQKPMDFVSACKEEDRAVIEKELEWQHIEYKKLREELSEPRITKEHEDGDKYITADIDHTTIYENAYTNDHFPFTQTHTIYEEQFNKTLIFGECKTKIEEHHVYDAEVIDCVNKIEEILKQPSPPQEITH